MQKYALAFGLYLVIKDVKKTYNDPKESIDVCCRKPRRIAVYADL